MLPDSHLTTLLREVEQQRQRQRRRRPLPMQPPASAEQLRRLTEKSQQLAYIFPPAYIALLREVNGIDSNGIVLYGSEPQPLAGPAAGSPTLLEGIVEANLHWREYAPNTQYVFFAESGERLYGQNLLTQKFESMDRITKELTYAPTSFESCAELLALLLQHMLGRYPGSED